MTAARFLDLFENVAQVQLWVLGAIVVLAVLVSTFARPSRAAVRAHLVFATAAFLALGAAKILRAEEMTRGADVMRDLGIFGEGAVLVSLVGFFIFSVLLPWCGMMTPRIVQDVAVWCSEVAWLFSLLWVREVNVSGIIAWSAVLTAVVGLALQDTLGNVVSGLALQMDDSLEVGNWVKVDDLQGRIVEMTWRYTAIETRNWETVLVPNSMLARGKVIVQGRRLDQPEQWRRWVRFNVDYRCAPSHVIETVQTALRMTELPNVAAAPPPDCVAMEFDDSFTRYAVRYWLTNPAADDPTDSMMRTHLFSALQRAGIALSIPAHAVFVTEEDSAARRERKTQANQKARLDALRRVRFFAALPEEEQLALAAQLAYAPFDAGDIMTRQGAEPHWLYIVTEGNAERYVENDEHKSIKVSTIGAGEAFGEWSLVCDTPRETTVIARSKVVAYRLPKDTFLQTLSRNGDLAQEIAAVIGQRRTHLEVALHNLDEAASAARDSENQSRVLSSLRRLLGV